MAKRREPLTPLTMRDLGFPEGKSRFALIEIAARLSRDAEDPKERLKALVAAQRTLEREVQRGNLRAERVGRRLVVTREELERYILANNTLTRARRRR
jgi:hypothetical protein